MKRILIADDEDLIRWSLSQFLESSGYNVDLALNGTEVISHLKNTNYDIIVTDLNMPGLNGIEILSKMKNMGANLPVIVISAYFSDKLKDETILNGAFECISKPFEMTDVLSIVKQAIETKSESAHDSTS